MAKLIRCILGAFFMLLSQVSIGQTTQYVIDVQSPSDLKDCFRHVPGGLAFVSAHRGGARTGYPENCLATFENTLSHTWAIIEIDPRYTKDGEIVLMHDVTLDRTTNGTGKVSDYTLEELRALRLKDVDGNLTDYQIPTLDEALQWAKGKTVMVIDEKDVPIDIRIQKIVENGAEANAMVIAYSLSDIKKAYALNRDIMMEVMAGRASQIQALDESGVPWENFIAFMSHNLPADPELVRAIQARGALCIQGTSRNLDIQFVREELDASELRTGYKQLFRTGIDMLEVDLAIEAGEAARSVNGRQHNKSPYLKKITIRHE